MTQGSPTSHLDLVQIGQVLAFRNSCWKLFFSFSPPLTDSLILPAYCNSVNLSVVWSDMRCPRGSGKRIGAGGFSVEGRGSDYFSNVKNILFQHCDNLSLFPIIPGTGEFSALAKQEDNIQTNDYIIMVDIMSSSWRHKGSFMKIWDDHFVWRREFKKCQMTTIQQFSSELRDLYSKENNPWIGGVQGLTSSGTLFLRNSGQEWV